MPFALRTLLPVLAATLLPQVVWAEPDGPVSFQRDVKPIFAERCAQCHGPDKASSGLRLTRRDLALAELDSGSRAIVPSAPDESELLRRVSSQDADERMPPEGEPLTPDEIDRLRRWIAEGAAWEVHWAYRPVERPAPPPVQNSPWVQSPIDAFVLARLEADAIEPSPKADRYTLIKRLSYDLLGLPPEPGEVDQFVADAAPNAYQRLVDRLLDSPHFGERWGRHWLDMARFADSDGYEKDNARPDAWRYRNWVIEAVNADMPFDQFTIEQLAGDLLPDATPMQRLATAFHRQTLTNTEGGTDQEEFRVEAVVDRVNTTAAVWLGLTVGCAQCHNHKYDEISQREYYQIFAFYNNGDETTTTVPGTLSQIIAYERAKTQHDAEVGQLQDQLAARKVALAEKLSEWETQVQAELAAEASQPAQYHGLDEVSVKAASGAKIDRLEDGSCLVSGDNSDQEQYTVTARTSLTGITGFRLEPLTDASLPAMGPGRAANGNFVLNEIAVYTGGTPELNDEHRVQLKAASADFAQDGFPVAHAIDPDPKTGWAVAPELGKEHWAVFAASEPVGAEGGVWLRIELKQVHGTQHTLGRFRLLAGTGAVPGSGPPDDVRTILAMAPDARDAAQKDALLTYFARQDEQYLNLEKQLAELTAKAPAPPDVAARVIAQRAEDPRTTHILDRGDFLRPGEAVEPGTLGVLHPLQPRLGQSVPDRLDLARWLVDPANPLTPRVIANHIWERLFGEGIVRTANDFGVRGEEPTHPQLLDWLASELVRQGWSRKALIRQIVTSAAYRQSSRYRPELAQRDPENRLLYRQNRMRVEAEIVRDLNLAVSGLLARHVGGLSVFPPLPPGVAELSYANNFSWTTSEGADRYRRGMYTFFKRTAPHPTLTMFDCPDSNTTCVERSTSNTPLQALALLNNVVFVEASQALAARVLSAGLAGDADRLSYAFRSCVVRPPAESESAALAELLGAARDYYRAQPAEAEAMVGGYAVEGQPPEETAAWVATVRIILNLDEFITRE